ncbi:hypothetical protein ACS0TY_027497 [Phlomoides rotata]
MLLEGNEGGVYRDNSGVCHGCFAMNHGRGFAFEAELATAFYALEIAYVKGWMNIWMECDSTYVVQFLKFPNPMVPWRFISLASCEEDNEVYEACGFSYLQRR